MSRNIHVVPAILTDSPVKLAELIRQTESFTNYVQIDIMDGKFVPSTSVSCNDVAALKTKLTWEVHLMVMEPETHLEDYHRAGAKKIVFHYKSTSKPLEIIRLIRHLGIKVGLAINPEVPVADFNHLAGKVDSVLFLAVNPGFYGAKFIPKVLDKIKEFRQKNPEMEIGIDGGIKEGNIAEIVCTGVDVIYVGSAIFLQPKPAESYRRLTELAGSNAK